jgi:hypothetical protein
MIFTTLRDLTHTQPLDRCLLASIHTATSSACHDNGEEKAQVGSPGIGTVSIRHPRKVVVASDDYRWQQHQRATWTTPESLLVYGRPHCMPDHIAKLRAVPETKHFENPAARVPRRTHTKLHLTAFMTFLCWRVIAQANGILSHFWTCRPT